MDGADCGIVSDGRKFRYRAAAIIIEDDRMLLLENDRDGYLYTVGGAVRIGETAEEAVMRECREEIGVDYEPERLTVIQEEFFEEPDGSGGVISSHELGFFFLMHPRGTSKGILSESDTEGIVERTRWIPLDELDGHTVVPSFLKDPGSYSGSLVHRVDHIE